MTPRPCERRGEVEAREDARLDSEQLADLEIHVATCEACAAELAALTSLHEEMRTVPPLEAAPHVVRAERDALLEKIEEKRNGRSAADSRRNAWLMFAAAALAIVAFFTERLVTRHPPVPGDVAVQAPATPVFDVANVRDAVWQSKVEGGTVRGTLASGVASFHVEHLGPGQRFLLSLPDGELEVRGTRFTVRVREGATERVDVTEGVVALHIRDEKEVVLHAGERWPATTAALPSATVAPSVVKPTGETPPPDAVRPPAIVVAAQAREPRSAESPSPAPPSAVVSKGSPASERFVAAMAAFNSGAYGRADSLLAAFVADFPADPRREDAAFLRAVAHERMGDHLGAAAHAREYLRAYPGGLRSNDARRLATAPNP